MDKLGGVKYWGAATSSHQVEGKTHNQWTAWELEHAVEAATTAEARYSHWLPKWEEIKNEASTPENYVSGIAVDHFERYEEDFDLARELNLNAFEFSVEWSRIEPEEGQWDEQAIEHYRAVIRALRHRGIEPFCKLWHWTNPVWFEQKGAFAKRANLKYFERFVEKITGELHDELSFVLTINEPNVYAGLSYQKGIWPPGLKSGLKALNVYRNLLRAHRRAYRVIKSIKPELRVGFSHHITWFYAEGGLVAKAAARMQAWTWNWWFLNRARRSQDFIGVNYYQSSRHRGLKSDNPNQRRNDLGWDMQPAHIEFVLAEVHRRYGRPIIITENGLADRADKDRQWWLEETLKAINRAIGQGAAVEGYLHWSLLDNFEWADGFWPRFGLIEVERGSLTRRIRPSARWLAQTIQTVRLR